MSVRMVLSVFVSMCVFAVQGQTLASRLDSLLRDTLFVDSDVSLAVFDLDVDSVLYSYGSAKLCRPASVLKVVTSVAALSRLGVDYEMETALYRSASCGDGENLYIRGSIDPLFDVADLDSMLAVLPPGLSVDTLFADCTFMDSVFWGPGWSWDDTPWEFQPYISPLMLCGGCVEVSASPAAKGEPPVVHCTPESGFYTIANEAVSRTPECEKFTILRDWLDNSNVIRLRGQCNAPKSEKMNMYPSQDFFLAVMCEHLAARGVNVGCVAFSAVPDSLQPVSVCRRPVAAVVREALMESDNLCAEALFFHLGALYGRRPVHWDMGAGIVGGFLESELGVSADFNIADGSGLSLYNYLSADMLLRALRFAHADGAIYSVMLEGLPRSGVSGTMKHRTKGTAAYKRIFAKTGTVKGVCTLAGYALARNGHTYAFVILNRNAMSSSAVRRWQDRVCDALCR